MLKKVRDNTTGSDTGSAAKSPAKAVKAAPKPVGASKAPAKATAAAAKSPAKTASAKAKPAPSAKSADKSADKSVKPKPKGDRVAFFAAQRELLHQERANYLRSAETLKAQADSLALEHEPGDVQFDEEGGEGGTANVDREMDLVLSAQARAAAADIDRALEKIEIGSYGLCEQCGEPIPDARLQALPAAALCVSCKSGGLSSRR